MKVIDWISEKEAEGKEVAIGSMGGFFKEGMRWKDYGPIKEEAEPYVNALRDSIIEHDIRLTGEEHQNSNRGVPLFEDGKIASFSFRGWGDLMAAVWSEHENKNYHYMDFYM